MFDAMKVKDACVQWIRDFFEENGKGCNAVVGISGGKDSSVTAALCVEALGRDRVIGVLMPGILAREIDRQGFRDALLAIAAATLLTALVLLAIGQKLPGV